MSPESQSVASMRITPLCVFATTAASDSVEDVVDVVERPELLVVGA
jgi:hypothetical protein